MANTQNNTDVLLDQARHQGASQHLSASQLKKQAAEALEPHGQAPRPFSGPIKSRVNYDNSIHSFLEEDYSDEYFGFGTPNTPQFLYRREIGGNHQERVKWRNCNLGLVRLSLLHKIVELVSKSSGRGRLILKPLQWRSWNRPYKEKFIKIVAALKAESCDLVRLLLMIDGSYKQVSLPQLAITCHARDLRDTENLVVRAIAMCNNQTEEAAKVSNLSGGRLRTEAILRAVEQYQKSSRCNQAESRLARCFLATQAGDTDAAEEGNTPSLPNPPALVRVSGDFYRRGEGRWVAAEDNDVRDTLIRWLTREPDAKLTRNFTGAVFDCVRAECNLSPYVTKLNVWVEFDQTPKATERYLLATENGLLDLEPVYREQPPNLLPHDARWLCLNALPYPFDPEAACKKWLSFLGEVLGPIAKEDKRIRVLQEWFGYCLLTDAPLQKFLLLQGQGANGKSVILEILRLLLGRENTAEVSLDQLGKPFGLQGLLGKIANICSDLSETSKTDEGVLKQLTGGDPVSVERKYRGPVMMPSGIKLAFSCNTLPVFNDKTGALWRRLILIPFSTAIPVESQNSHLVTELTAELPGILNWAIKGLQRLRNQHQFTKCRVCDQANEEHRLDCSPVAQFLEETVPQLPELQRKKIATPALHKRYLHWCEGNGYMGNASRTFVTQLRSAGIEVWKSHGVRWCRPDGLESRPLGVPS